MVLPLPTALANFSSQSLKNIQSLDAIQKTLPNPQSIVRDNVAGAVTKSVTSQPTDVFNGAPDYISGASSSFVDSITSPPGFSSVLQTESLKSILGTGLSSGLPIDQFIAQNIRLEDIVPAQQIFSIAKSLGAQSLYVDPLQAYAQVAQASADLTNLCDEARFIIADLQADLANLLSIQSTMNYQQISSMNSAFFGTAGEKANDVLLGLNIANATFNSRGRFDPAQMADLCDALDALTNFVMFANSKILQFELLRKKIDAALKRLRGILKQLAQVIANVAGYLPAYVASAAIGRLFNAVQAKVLEKGIADLSLILRDLQAFLSLNADDRSKLLLAFAIGATAQILKAYLCEIDPATDVEGVGDPIVAALKAGYDTLAGVLSGNPITGLLTTFESLVSPLSQAMAAGMTVNNAAHLSSEVASMSGALTALAGALLTICAAGDTFKVLFKTETSLDPNRVFGANDLMWNINADAARDTMMSSSPGDFTGMSLSEATTPGQLAESLRTQIEATPAGPQRDNLIVAYSQVYGRHRAAVLSMDFQRREDVRTFLAPVGEEADRQLINKTVETFSGEDFEDVRSFL